MTLKQYREKRDFRRTSEPRGKTRPQSTGRTYVIQKHAASRLHYDLRLEVDGVLKSWAVPKGPSLDPSVKSLAIEVEDHPLDYASFEGTIPANQYGGGTVMVWDQGTWEPEGDPQKSLRAGELKFTLYGEKLQGGWVLVRMRKTNEKKRNWLLIKHRDQFAQDDSDFRITEANPLSILSGRSLEQIAGENRSDGRRNGRHSNRPKKPAPRSRSTKTVAADPGSLTNARKAKLPGELRPQLATLTHDTPQGDDWLHELKFDGYRLLCHISDSGVRLLTRRGHDWSDRFGAIQQAVAKLNFSDTILDGELVALDEQGVSDFQRLQNWLNSGRQTGLTYYVFDAPFFSGYDLRKTPLVERKELLASALLAQNPENQGPIRYSDHIRGSGGEVLQHSCQHAMEGIISKRSDSPYESRRTRSWLKSKCQGRQEFVIGGFTKPGGSRTHFGALLLGYRKGSDWVYCGRVGTGFTDQTLKELGGKLQKLRRGHPPFRNPPTGAQARDVTWVEPQLVAEVEFSEWTDDGMLRHPAFQGLREDKPAQDVVREDEPVRTPRHSSSNARPSKSSARSNDADDIAGVALTSPDRVLFPEQNLTKRELAEYYVSVAERILPHVIDRPLTLVRCPQGRSKNCFYQKHWTDSLPDAVDSVSIQEKEGKQPYVVIHDLQGLISLVQMNVLELHPWSARTDQLERPDQLIFDLDPGEGVGWTAIRQAATDVRELLEALGWQAFVRTSGGKGLHVVVPITRRNDWDEVADFAERVAKKLADRHSQKYVANMRKDVRKGKVFIDYLRNRRGATAVASYSTRARPGAPVATPIRWDELPKVSAADQWNVETLPRRLQSLQDDPWADFFTVRQSITKAARSKLDEP